MEFHNQIAVVTGAGTGIGAAVALALAAQGAHVAVLDQDAASAADTVGSITANGGRALALTVNVRDGAAVEAAIARIETELGPIAVLANVAGILRPSSILDLDDADWEATFDVNCHGTMRVCRSVARRMVARRAGSIVIVGSNAANTPRINMGAYAASKAAAAQFGRCLALELAEYGIRCNLVSPGSTYTAMQRQLWTGPESEQAVIDGALASHRLGIPLRRIATPEDIADAVCFLASPRARHITMHDLRVDGGATLDA
ncbi:2,3-dihydro-2,3-dihydroxybenzoate dehydrogenase [Andreprevotia sp. IGB-42]|uniref:2,3-dihydro-2,3-dihydroxybenzoate dehydrogenase n=1 Tax=Andreprevotia sp. IGB-42 TaxID=2497473 RepID=UPI001357EF01|nr:2,3-dihydro-2,3-dihydroxybenzoate dehydrogenase [Andreprevotia sp. IGB-42]KAF0812692.1 2,3-dihydro-2,3-dihydroxybenzoate dehydrogenase [Andreprevotia sp. IGB-42]